jgi:hypothetical protein
MRPLGRPMIVLVLLLLLLVGLVISACGGSSGAAATTAPAGSPTTEVSASTTAAVATPDQLGEQIGTVYVGALRDVALLLKDKPEVAAVRSQAGQLKESTVTKLVELGRSREAMGTAERAKVDSKITKALDGAAGEEWYATYNEVWKHYSTGDNDFANLVASFNVIGQYANFDLLKKQLPAEAARLGIK